MNDEDSFFRAIHATPNDDLPKLVYADWLDEHGQLEKAAFIRNSVAGKKSQKVWTRWGTPNDQIGKAWYDLYTGNTLVWDAPTLLALGRLQGLLDGLAAGNDHTANIAFHFSASLHLFGGDMASLWGEVYDRGEPEMTSLDDWRGAFRSEFARWIGMDQGTASPRAIVRRSHQTPEGCAGTAEQVMQLLTEVMVPERGWRIDPPAAQRWGIDYTHLLLTGCGRAVHLTFDFDD